MASQRIKARIAANLPTCPSAYHLRAYFPDTHSNPGSNTTAAETCCDALAAQTPADWQETLVCLW